MTQDDRYEAFQQHESGNCGNDPKCCEWCYHDQHEHATFVFGTVCIED